MIVTTLTSMPIEDIEIGMSAVYSHTITADDVERFADISGDKNPVHLCDEYAEKTRFGGRIAHGLMSASFFSGIFGTRIPGPGCVYMSQSLEFKRPVYIGDTVEAIVTVENVDRVKQHISFRTECRVKNKVVISGVAKILIPKVK